MSKILRALTATGAAVALALSGCAGRGGDAAPGGQTGEDQREMSIAVFNGWPEGEAVSYLWQHVLEQKGYDVTLEYVDVAPGYVGLSQGDLDVNLDVWLPLTHASYMEEYGDDLVNLGAWNDNAKLTMAVNADAPIDSLDELAANADTFDNRIVGIEPGAGLTMAVGDAAIPQYGLEAMDFQTSSTPAMLTVLEEAMGNDEDVLVTLWRPHWAYDAYDLKDLEDPRGALGAAESMNTVARADFEEDFPQAATWLRNFRMESDPLYSLENAMFNAEGEVSQDDYPEIVAEWASQNQEYVDSLTA